MPVARRKRKVVSSNSKNSSVVSPPPIANSPYMFYHGGIEDSLLAPPPAEKSGKKGKGRKKSKADKEAAAQAAAAALEATMNEEEDDENDEDEEDSKKAKPSELCLAFQANNSEFTDGISLTSLKELNQRNVKQGKIKIVNDFLTHPKSANLATFHRLVAKMVLRDATTKSKEATGKNGTDPASPLIGGKQNRSASFAEAGASNLSFDATMTEDASMSMFGSTAGGGNLARRANDVKITSLTNLLRDNYQINASNLLNALGDGLRKMNDQLRESSPTVAASDGAIPFLVLMDLVDRYVNGANATDTRHACFAVFDIHGLRCLTMKTLRAMRGKKADEIRLETNGGTFAMLKVILDTFAHNEELSTTLTKEQVVPIFDVDQGVLVEGFMEEILRQIVQNEFGVERKVLLAA